MRLAVAAALCALLTIPAAAEAAKPKPKTAKTVVVERASGNVRVKPRGKRSFSRLDKAVAVPVGSTIDATDGHVKLTSTANRSGSKLQSAEFYDGEFSVSQKRASRPLTDLTLTGGDFSSCVNEKRRTGVFASRATRRRLWGKGRGRFRTRGRNGTATVRGTTWLTEDGCEETKALARTGVVKAESKESLNYDLDEPNESVVFTCNTEGIEGISRLYCLAALSRPANAKQPFDLVGFGIATVLTPQDTYTVCVSGSDGSNECGDFPFKTDTLDDGTPIKVGGIGCVPGTPGQYAVQWLIGGTALPVPLPYTSTTPSAESGCVSDPPRPGIDTPARLSGKQLGQARAAARVGH